MVPIDQSSRSDGGSRVEIISANAAAVSAFALTRVTMALVILGTLFIGGFGSPEPVVFIVQIGVAATSVLALGLSIRTLIQRGRVRTMTANQAWGLILLDSILAVGVMVVIDAETSPLAWVALITPVLETAVLFSMLSAGLVWLGLSLAFLAFQLTTNASDNATTDTLVLSIQQLLAVLFVAGPASLMADSAEQRIEQLAEARRSADETSKRLRSVATSARLMSQDQTIDGILGIVSQSASEIGFDQADVVVRDERGNLRVHSIDSNGPALKIDPEILSSNFGDDDVASASKDDSAYGDALRLAGVDFGYSVSINNETNVDEPNPVLRAWNKQGPASVADLQVLALLVGHARETYRAAELLSEAQSHADRLRHEVRHDGLTGLANRAFVLETLEDRIETSESMALFFIDLDGFKDVNDNHGHRAGDAALVEVANRLLETKRDGELVGRMGGDEFVLLTPMTSFDNLETLRAYGDEIVESLSEPIEFEDEVIELGASTGVAVHDGDLGPDQFISQADDAMYEVKRRGGGTEISNATVDLFEEERKAS